MNHITSQIHEINLISVVYVALIEMIQKIIYKNIQSDTTGEKTQQQKIKNPEMDQTTKKKTVKDLNLINIAIYIYLYLYRNTKLL